MSYTFTQFGSEIQAILDRAEAGGQIDQDIAAKQDALTFDDAPISDSDNPVKSGGIYDAIQAGGAAALAAFATDSVSGDVVSFPDGADGIPVKAFTGSIIPVQNLNGYDNPWPAGGGANIWNEEWENGYYDNGTPASGTGIRSKADSYITITPSTSYYCKCGVSANIAMSYYDSSKNYISNYVVSGGSGVFTTPASAYYLRFHVAGSYGSTYNNNIAINYPSTVTTYSPYSNICPISGWTGANIYRTGVNVWDEQWEVGGMLANTLNAKNLIPVKAGETYCFHNGAGASFNFKIFNAERAVIQSGINLGNNGTYTMPSNAAFMQFRMTATYGTTYNNDISINYPSTDTTYHAYDGQTILLTFGSTVYVGTITALGGGKWSIQPTHEIVTYDGSADEGWTLEASGRYYIELDGLIKSLDYATYGYVMCDRLKTVAQNSSAMADLSITGYADTNNTYPTKNWLYVRQSAAADLASYKTWLGSNNLEVVYRLATLPDPIIVSASDLATLLGSNNVWTDCGSVTELTYRADTALYIQKLLNGGALSTISMASPTPTMTLDRPDTLTPGDFVSFPSASEEVVADEPAEEQADEPSEEEATEE